MTDRSNTPEQAQSTRDAQKRGPLSALLDAIVRMSTTRLNYWLELVIDVTLGVTLLAFGVLGLTHRPFSALATVLVGLLIFTFLEYFFHRWMFHSRVPLFEQGHEAHHQQPLGYDSMPFFLPPVVLLILAGLFALAMPAPFALLLTGAITMGYVAYGMSHFIIHHRRFQTPWLRRWAGWHHIHHHHPDKNFGVTTQLWDILFHTRYVQHHSRS